MKRIVAVFLALALLICAFTGCEDKNKDTGKNTVSWVTTSGDSAFNVSGQNSASQESTSSSKPEESSSQSSAVSSNASTPSSNSSTTNDDYYDSDDSDSPSYQTNLPCTIFYHNGDSKVDSVYFSNDYWNMPFAREDDGSITKDGYVLLGYSFSKNGKGELIRPGYKYSLPTQSAEQKLYCVWAKETAASNFETAQTGSTVQITAYKGNDKVVYIPREIGGKAVTAIASNAFANNKTLQEVHITSSITRVASKAFANCKNLKTVTLYDNLTSISDAAFTNSPVKTVRLCAGKTPRYITSVETFGIKYERLIKTKGQKRVIVVAGSSALYGIDSDYMQGLFADDVTVINFGTNANQSLIYYLEAIAPHLTKKDIVIFAPEQYGPFAYHTNGNPELPYVTLQGSSTCYNLFENIDASKYTGVFNAIGQYCSIAERMPELSWEDHSYKVDKFGDLSTLTSQMNSPYYRCGNNGYFRFDDTVIPEKFISNLNRVIDCVSNTKAKIYFSYPPHNKNNIEDSSNNEDAFDFYNNWIEKTVNCPLISDVRDYFYTGEYFDNTDYHLNTVGRELHSKQLAQDIKAAKIGVK